MTHRLPISRPHDSSITILDLPGDHSSEFVLGGIGHRSDRVNPLNSDEIRAQIRLVLQQVQTTCSQDPEQPRALRLMASLADGADRLFVQEALAMKLPVSLILPFEPNRFREDFPTEASAIEFEQLLHQGEEIVLPTTSEKPGYEAASATIIEHADLLITVWDGRAGNGAGGTEHSIHSALEASVPVVTIDCNAPYDIRLLHQDAGNEDASEATVTKMLKRLPVAD